MLYFDLLLKVLIIYIFITLQVLAYELKEQKKQKHFLSKLSIDKN